MFSTRSQWFKIGVNLQYLINHSSSSSLIDTLQFNYIPKLSTSDQEKVLTTINQSDRDQLLCLNIAQTKASKLENYKRKNGPFKSVYELLEVDGLSVKALEKLCKQIISESPGNIKPVNSDNKKIKQILVPALTPDVVISSSVGVHLAPMGVSWAKINSKNQLEYWDYHDFGNLPKKMCPIDTFRLAGEILNKLPQGDAYVFEANSNMAMQGPKPSATVTSYTQQMELCSMLLALINTSKTHNIHYENSELISDLTPNCVYFLRSKLPARLFRTLVGNECVSCTNTVLHLLGEPPTENVTLPCSPLTLSLKLKCDYSTQSSGHKELLGQALMLIVAFVDICVKRNPVSIRAVIPGRK